MNNLPDNHARKIQNVDIAVCTWNRASLLARTLESFSKLIVPDEITIQFLIVDNNSEDETEKVIRDFCELQTGSGRSVVSLKEPKQGHTFSRNCAVGHAESDLMVWTDDDVTVEQHWVAKYVDAANLAPDTIFWGAEIAPEFENKPKWIGENWEILKGCFAVREFEGELELGENRLPYGANFAIRTSVQKEFLYDQELGRRGDEVLGEDELDLFRRLLKAGYRGNWVPVNSVRHFIPKERSTEEYVYEYFVGQGRALVAKGEPWHEDVKKLASESKTEYRNYKLKRLVAGSKVWVSHLVRSALAHGQAEALR